MFRLRNDLVIFALLLLLISGVSAQAEPGLAVDKIIIKKSERKMKLMAGDTLLHEYKIALGGNPVGKKQCEGDSKTPEGKYRISGRNPNSAYHLSLRVSYPNSEDRKRAKRLGCSPGGDIMIHGLAPAFKHIGASHTITDWTEGCIAVTNEEIEEIWKLVKNQTLVEILP